MGTWRPNLRQRNEAHLAVATPSRIDPEGWTCALRSTRVALRNGDAITEYQIALDKGPRLRVKALSAPDAVALVARTFRDARLAVAIEPGGKTSAFTIDRTGTPRLLHEGRED